MRTVSRRLLFGTMGVLAVCFTGSNSLSAIIASEAFDYTSGAVLGTQTGGTGWTSTWRTTATLGATTSPLTVSATSLSAPAAMSAPTGGSVGFVGSSLIARQMSTSIDLNTDADYYVSLLTSRTGTRTLTAGLYTTTGVAGAIFGHNSATSGVIFVGGIGATSTSSPAVTISPTTLWLFKIAAKSGAGLDQVFLKIYPSTSTSLDATEPVTWSWTGIATASNVVLDRFVVATNTNTGSLAADEIRVTTSWAEAISVPEPAFGVLGLLGGAFLMGRRRTAV